MRRSRQQFLRTGKIERVPQSRYGPVSRVTAVAENWLRDQVRAIPDATLAELRQGLGNALGIEVSRSHMGRLLHRMQLRLKKNRSTPPSKTRKKAAVSGKRGGSR